MRKFVLLFVILMDFYGNYGLNQNIWHNFDDINKSLIYFDYCIQAGKDNYVNECLLYGGTPISISDINTWNAVKLLLSDDIKNKTNWYVFLNILDNIEI